MLWTIYRAGTTLAGPLIEAYLRKRERRGREDRDRRGERRGIAAQTRPPGRLIWIHAASVGESLSVLPLVARVRDRQSGCHVLVTTGTVTSARLMAERLPAGAFHQYVPVDRIAWVRRFLDHWRPDAALWIESEFWPNLILETHRRSIPMALVNARISAASAKGWRRIRRATGQLLQCFQLCLAQTNRVAAILTELGAGSVAVAGNLKLAAPPLPADAAALDQLRAMVAGRLVWLAASTHPGEEQMIIAVDRLVRKTHPQLLTIIAPRHPGRGEEVATLVRAAEQTVACRSANQLVSADIHVYVADTMGEMGVFYRVTDAAFVGGSWVGRGGQNPYEPAQLGCPVLFGPDMWNFPEISSVLCEAGAALTVADPAACAAALERLLGGGETHAEMAQAGLQVSADQSGVLDRLEVALAPVLFGESGGPGADADAGRPAVDHARA